MRIVRIRPRMDMDMPAMERILSVPTGLTRKASVGTVVVFLTTRQAKLVRWLQAHVASPGCRANK